MRVSKLEVLFFISISGISLSVFAVDANNNTALAVVAREPKCTYPDFK